MSRNEPEETDMIDNRNNHPNLALLTKLTISCGLVMLAIISCGGNDSGTVGPGGTIAEISGDILYSRFRLATGSVGPVLSEGSGFDASEVDSPAITIDGGRAGGDKFMLFYEAQDLSGTNTIGLVTSNEEDFVILTIGRTQVIGLGGANSGYQTGATDPTVIVDKRPAEAARRYKIWFEGRNGSVSTTIYATSVDGLNWTGFTPCTGLTPSFGQIRVADPTVILEDNTYKMWFEAIKNTFSGKDGPGVIGYAESTDGITWTIKDAAGNSGNAAGPVFSEGATGQFDGYSVNAPSVLVDSSFAPGIPGRYKLWYEAGDNSMDVENTIGYATSADGLIWNRATLPVMRPSSDFKVPLPFDSGDLEHPVAAIIYSVPANMEGHFLLWYTGDGEANASPNRIGLAKGSLP